MRRSLIGAEAIIEGGADSPKCCPGESAELAKCLYAYELLGERTAGRQALGRTMASTGILQGRWAASLWLLPLGRPFEDGPF